MSASFPFPSLIFFFFQIDYKGHRLVAMSILPIDPERTLQYGSKDGGRSVINTDPELSRKMENAAKKLNLKVKGLEEEKRRRD
jgi:hypothetical protein